MNHTRSLFLLFLVLVLSLRGVRPDDNNNAGQRSQDADVDKHEPGYAERAIGLTGLSNRWDAIRTWAKLAWMNIRPPDSKVGAGSDSSGAIMMREAATRSFETSKEAVAHAAEAAAKAAGEATEKLKRSMSGEESSTHSDEL